MDKQLREAIEKILTSDGRWSVELNDDVDQLLALFHTYGNRERVEECKKLKKMCKRRDTQISDNTFVACVFESEIEQRIEELNREVES